MNASPFLAFAFLTASGALQADFQYNPSPSPVGHSFSVERMPAGFWRVYLATRTDGLVTFRDFGRTAEDRRRAVEQGRQWASTGPAPDRISR